MEFVRLLIRSRGVPERDIEDVAQQIFAAVHRALPSFDPARPLKPWLKTIALRIIRDYFELGCIKNERLTGTGNLDAQDPTPVVANQLATKAMLQSLLDTLDDDERLMIVRYDLEKIPLVTIAQELKISEGKGWALLRRAHARLIGAARRHEAKERRVLGGSGGLLLPLGLAMPTRAWIMRARSALARLLSEARSLLVAPVGGAGVAMLVGALLQPPRAIPAAPVARTEAAAPVSVALDAPLLIDAPAAASSVSIATSRAAAQPTAAARPAALPAERRSLQDIQATLVTDPAAALRALAVHKQTFAREEFRDEREAIEGRVLAAMKASASPP